MNNTSPTSPALHTPAPWVVNELKHGYGASEFQIANDEEKFCVAVTPRYLKAKARNYARAEANARLMAAAPDMRQASQRFYDAVQNYLDVPDSELPGELVEAMDELEAAWRRADGTQPEPPE